MTEEHRINIMEEPPQAAAANPAQAQEPQPLAYAAVTERFVALAIDYGVIFLPLQLLAWLICKLFGTYLELEHLVAMAVAMNVIFILYEAIFSCGGRVTLGKNLVGIAVVKKDLSGPISFPRALLRAIGYYISAFLFFGGFVLALVDDRKRALHDFLGSSVVVQLRERAGWEIWAVRSLGTVLIITFAASLYQSFGGRNWQEKYKVRQAQDFLQKIAILEEGHLIRYGYYTNDLLRLSLLSGDPVQFQRDMHKALGRRGFKIGVDNNIYKISAQAKDKKNTPVYYTNKI